MDVGNNILIRNGVAYPADPQELQGRIENQSIRMLKDQIRDTAWRLRNPTRSAVEAVVRYRLTSMQGACARALMHMTDFEFYDGIEENIRDEVQEQHEEQIEKQEALDIEEDINKFKRKNVNREKGYEAPRGSHGWKNMRPEKRQRTWNQTPTRGQVSGSAADNGLKCQNCGEVNRTRQTRNKARHAHIKCYNCGEMGHFSDKCTKPRRNNKIGECSQRPSRCRSL